MQRKQMFVVLSKHTPYTTKDQQSRFGKSYMLHINFNNKCKSNGKLQAFIRFPCEVGHPKLMVIDKGSPLIKGCDSMRICFTYIKGKLHRDTMVDFTTCPVGDHNYNGKAKRRIKHVKESLEKIILNQRLSVLQWDTIAPVSNAINDLPLALVNIVSDFKNMDLITPNWLKIGRNNERIPVSPMEVVGNYLKILEENKKIFNIWFETWLITHTHEIHFMEELGNVVTTSGIVSYVH